jgi:hypothetical protein
MARRTHSTEKRKEFIMFEQEEMIENVEPTTEEAEVQVEQDEEEVIADESAKVYTEEDFRIYKEEHDRRLDKKVSRAEAKIRKEYERKYGNLENVLRAGSGRETVEEMTDAFAEHYKKQGINIPEQPQYNANDIKVLARAEADEIIGMGFDEVIEETDRLAKIGVANMNDREKEVFRTLAEYRQKEERNTEYEKLGVTKEVYTSQEFKDFASKFTKDTPVNEIINIFNSMKPRKEVQTAGSMKTNRTDQVKDYYTEADIERLTLDDLDKPGVWEAVRRSMTGGR